MAKNRKPKKPPVHVPDRIKNVALGLLALVVAVAAVYTVKHTGPPASAADQGLPTPSPSAEPKRISFLGDSYAAGSNEGGVREKGFPQIVATRLGMTPQLAAVGGTGYLTGSATNTQYSSRVDRVISYKPQVIVVEGSRNDATHTTAEVREAAQQVLMRLHTALPSAKILVIGPIWWSGAQDPTNEPKVIAGVEQAAKAVGLPFVDPMAQDWLPAAHPEWIGTDKIHPTDAGHAHLAVEVERFLAAQGVR